jgi:tetratricopeptide (TPR) repeat protein
MRKCVAGERQASRFGAMLLVACLAACAASGGGAERESVAADVSPEAIQTDPLGSYLAGRHAQHEHDYAAAAVYFGRALAADPDDYDLINKAFVFDVTEGHVAEATVLATRINGIDRAAALPNLVLTLGKLKAGDYAGAAAEARSLPHEGIQRFVTPLVIAWCKAGLGDTAGVAPALAPLRDVQGFGPVIDFHEGLIADYGGRVVDAEAAYKRVLQSSTRANWREVDALGSLYERNGRAEEARALYQRFVTENSDSDLVSLAQERLAAKAPPPPRIASPGDGAAEALFDLATLLNQTETADLALIYGRLALDLRPDFPFAQLLVADILAAQHRPAAALALDRAIDPQSPFGWSARMGAAANLAALGRTDEAISDLKAMAAERKDSRQPMIELGDLLRGKNRFAEAVEAYDQASARIGTPSARDWGVFYSRGVALERDGNWQRAEADLRHALQLQPEQPVVLNYLGYSWIEKGQHLKDALGMIERAVKLRPNDGYIVDSLGWALYRVGDYPRATQHLEHAVEMLPEDPTINDHLGDAYWRTGREVEARNQWRRALQFKPEEAEAKIIEAKLDRGLGKPAPAAGTAQGG